MHYDEQRELERELNMQMKKIKHNGYFALVRNKYEKKSTQTKWVVLIFVLTFWILELVK